MELFKNNIANNDLEAYLLGFIYADGYITSKRNGKYYILGISLSIKDIDILKDIAKIFNKEIKIKENKCNNKKYLYCQLLICDVNFVSKMISMGIYPQKTYNSDSSIFDKIPENYKYAFIRGYFDGDGTVFKKRKNYYCFGFVSHQKSILEKISKYFLQHKLMSQYTNIRKDGSNFRLIISGNNSCCKFRDHIYKNSEIFLKRKRDMLAQIKKITYKQTNPYIGVFFYKKNQKWAASIYIDKNNRRKHIGLFNTPQEAALAYNNEAIKLKKRKINNISIENNNICLIKQSQI
jgi:hypothetical protein